MVLSLVLPYIRKFKVGGKKTDFVLTMTPLQSLLLKAAESVQMDVTYNENKDLSKMLHLCTFSNLAGGYVSLVKYRTNAEDSKMFESAVKEMTKIASEDLMAFDLPQFQWSDMDCINVDWSAAQQNGIYKAIGEETAQKLLKGCSVHFCRSYQKAACKYTTDTESKSLFLQIGGKIMQCKEANTVVTAFGVLGGEVDLSALSDFADFNSIDKSRHFQVKFISIDPPNR